MHKTLMTVFAGLLFTIMFIACDKEDDSTTYTLGGAANANQEVPAGNSNGSGNLSGTLDSKTGTINYLITWTGLSGSATGLHFHGPAPAGVNKGILHGLTIVTNGTNGTGSGSGTLTNVHDTTIQHFLNGNIYYNIHSAVRPGGEIRGQVTTVRQ